LDHELAQGLSAVVIGWVSEHWAARQAWLQRLNQADCRHVVLLVLVAEPGPVDACGFDVRPLTQVLLWQQHTEAPQRVRGLLAQLARDALERADPKVGLRILLVDDSRTSRTKYQRLLKRQGHAVVTCEHADAALAVVERESFDLAIIDYHMPGLNGAMLCRALRKLPATRELTLTILTGSYEEGVISDCLSAGAAECMFKAESDELFLARVQSMARLREREVRLDDERARLDSILASVGDGVYGVDRAGVVTFVNPAALRLLQFTDADELVGMPAHERIHFADEGGRPVASDVSFLQQAYELGDSLSDWQTVFWRADGQALVVECTVRPLHLDGRCEGAVVAFRDIAERKRIDAELQWQADHDHLTQLYNRQHFEDTLEQEIVRLKRSSERSALLFIDLDRFKQINDSAGHAAGDALLVNIGHKLKRRSRQSDMVARLGGDEFAVLLRNVDDIKVAELAEKYRSVLEEMRFVYKAREFDVSGSVGVVALDRHTLGPAKAMNCADAACQIAKRQGRNQVHHFDADDDAAAVTATGQSWVERLQQALATNAFALQFQPILELRSLPAGAAVDDTAAARLAAFTSRAGIYGYEVLLRLDDAEARLPPRAFLPQAERFEMLPALDGWVLDHLATRLAEKPPRGTRFHVNVATVSLLDAGYRARLAAMLDKGVFEPGQLCLELKESDAIRQLIPVQPALAELARRGLNLMLDEFGGGFDSLGLLRSLPFTAVKLDGKVIQSLTHDALSGPVVRAMTELAHAMNLVVIAPLVEDTQTLQRLHAAGADCAQGFALGESVDGWKPRAAALSARAKGDGRVRQAWAKTAPAEGCG
ncbi:MAG TPA: EAL domain-containing protein, partial [Rhizobacter sp.]|nr:EAL domain-containing protein [Rhizobacter sp.]